MEQLFFGQMVKGPDGTNVFSGHAVYNTEKGHRVMPFALTIRNDEKPVLMLNKGWIVEPKGYSPDGVTSFPTPFDVRKGTPYDKGIAEATYDQPYLVKTFASPPEGDKQYIVLAVQDPLDSKVQLKRYLLNPANGNLEMDTTFKGTVDGELFPETTEYRPRLVTAGGKNGTLVVAGAKKPNEITFHIVDFDHNTGTVSAKPTVYALPYSAERHACFHVANTIAGSGPMAPPATGN